ncbi:FeoB-associated Cys-rich membrane protein [Luteolibacter marinus]|nr:FeoB-associated Cys-rich membrane protein [Luteolibacter marinus]
MNDWQPWAVAAIVLLAIAFLIRRATAGRTRGNGCGHGCGCDHPRKFDGR